MATDYGALRDRLRHDPAREKDVAQRLGVSPRVLRQRLEQAAEAQAMADKVERVLRPLDAQQAACAHLPRMARAGVTGGR